MKQFGKIMLMVLGLAVLAAALSSVPSRSAAASSTTDVKVVNTPLPVTLPSQWGTGEANLVTLSCSLGGGITNCGEAGSPWDRIISNGTPTTVTPYTGAPAGQALVVTDLTWVIVGGSTGTNTVIELFDSDQKRVLAGTGSLADSQALSVGATHFAPGILYTGVPYVSVQASPPGTVGASGPVNLLGYFVAYP